VLVEPVAARLRAIIGEVIAGANAVLVDLAIEPDRVEMKVEVEPRLGIHRLVKRIKATSAGSLRNEFPRLRSRLPTLWNNNYYVSTIGRPERAAALRFLEEQREV
jgi:putative transposase